MCAVIRSSSCSCVGLAVNLLLSFVAAVGRGGRTPSGGRPVNGSIIAPRIAWNDWSWLLLGLLSLVEKAKEGEGREGRRQCSHGRKHGDEDRQRKKARSVRKVLSEGRAKKHGQPDVVHTIPAECLVTLLTILWLAVLGMMKVLPTNDKWSRFGFV